MIQGSSEWKEDNVDRRQGLSNTPLFVNFATDFEKDPAAGNVLQLKTNTMGGETYLPNSFNNIDLPYTAYWDVSHEKHTDARELVEALQALKNIEKNKIKLHNHYAQFPQYGKTLNSVTKNYTQSVCSSLANIKKKN